MLIVLGIILWVGFSAWLLGLAWLAAINLVTVIVYRYDKAVAGGERTRVPEVILLLLALLGGWPGAFIAMYQFKERHKTRKFSFRLGYWTIVALYGIGVCSYFIWFR